MPGIFESLSRIFKGEPVFQPSDDDEFTHKTPIPQAGEPVIDRSSSSDRTDGKIAPVVIVDKVKCDVNGEQMTLSAEIKNTHVMGIYLDKILLLGTKYELDRDMRPGEEREFIVYRGSRPGNTHATKCEVLYRDTTGDYFSAIHYVEFRKLQDGMWIVDEIKFLPPVKDI